MLLPPIIPKVYRINIIFQDFLDLGDVVIGNNIEQLMDKLRVIVEIHQQGLQPSQCPGTLIQ